MRRLSEPKKSVSVIFLNYHHRCFLRVRYLELPSKCDFRHDVSHYSFIAMARYFLLRLISHNKWYYIYRNKCYLRICNFILEIHTHYFDVIKCSKTFHGDKTCDVVATLVYKIYVVELIDQPASRMGRKTYISLLDYLIDYAVTFMNKEIYCRVKIWDNRHLN